MTPPALRVEHLRKAFAGRPAVHDLSFEVRRGEIFGLLGHNGAGKSTAFGMLLGLVSPDAGDTWVGSSSLRTERAAALAKVGAIFETPSFYDYLSGWDNLVFLVSLSGVKPDPCSLQRVAAQVGLHDRIRDKVRTYSHGMRQRLGLAQALLPGPEILLLDEPTDGLDPLGIQEMRSAILHLRNEHGLTVLLSSHLLSEVEQLCDRVAILHEGRLLFCGEWSRGTTRWRFEGQPEPLARNVLLQCGLRAVGDAWEAPDDFHPGETVASLVAAGVKVGAVHPVRRTLEDFYLETIGV